MASSPITADLKACFDGRVPARMPVFALGLEFDMLQAGLNCAQTRTEVEPVVRATIAAIRQFGYDWAVVFPDDYVEFEHLGLTMQVDPDVPAVPREYLPLETETLRGFELPDAGRQGRMPVHLATLRRLKEDLGATACVMGRIAAPFSAVALLYGVNELLTGILLRPELVRDNMDFLIEHQVAFGQAQFDAGADMLWLGDCLAASNFIGLDHLDEFALPAAAEVAKRLEASGYLVYHAAETNPAYIQRTAQLPVAAINVGEGVSIAELKRTLEPKQCLMGNFDPKLLRDGEPESIREETRRMLAANMPGGAYIFNTGEGVMANTPPENVKAMMEAARECSGNPELLR